MIIKKRSKPCSTTPTRAISVCLALSFLPSLALAQAGKQVVSVAPIQKFVAKRGSVALQNLDLTVDSGYHVNSDKPKDEFLIPLKLTWTSNELQPVRIIYPASELVKVGSDTLNVFTGKFSIKTEFQVSP